MSCQRIAFRHQYLSGYGDYVARNIIDNEKNGMYIIDRKTKNFNEAADALTDIMMDVVKLTRRDRISLRYKSEEASLHFDWSNLLKHYTKAYSLAVTR